MSKKMVGGARILPILGVAIRREAEERAREAAIQTEEEAKMAAELAEAEARNLWDAEATT